MAINSDISDFLEQLALMLDMPVTLYEQAIEKYQDVGAWLSEKDKQLGRRDPEVYPQGSFRLGTIIRPISDRDEYDVDLVYLRDLLRTSTTQAKLQAEAGAHLHDYVKDKESSGETVPRLNPGRRCWTLTYDNLGFHMDVLPAIPDDEDDDTAILVTDRKLTEWQHSDPIGYANWFWARMQAEVEEQRLKLAREVQANVADVPDWKVKTTLQRAVQILKRHRDIRFQNDLDDRPISIIITTLAAKAYQRQANLYEALTVILRDIGKYVENRAGVWWVPNPVNPDENFADKWRDYPQRAEKFFWWMRQAQRDFADLEARARQNRLIEGATQYFGKGATERSAANLQLVKQGVGAIVASSATEGVPAPADTRHRQPPPWTMQDTHRVTVKADVYARLLGKKKLWKLTRFPINKLMGIKFVAETNVPPPYEVLWQVVNTGADARNADGLRGGFDNGVGMHGAVRWESTSYRGTHFIEAFVVKEDVCLARSGQIPVRIR